MTSIDRFDGENRFLSNFWPCKLQLPYRWRLDYEVGFAEYASVEHAYQGCKTLEPNDRFWVSTAPSPGEAKKRGRQVRMRDDWDQRKNDLMWDLVSVKFEDTDLRAKLLATGDAELIEGNHWGDVYWGVCRGVGQNWLGRILMDVRTAIREAP